jgi:hypothetical protein
MIPKKRNGGGRYLLTIVVEKKNGFGILYMKYDYL